MPRMSAMTTILTPAKRRRIANARKRQEAAWQFLNGPVIRITSPPLSPSTNSAGDFPIETEKP